VRGASGSLVYRDASGTAGATKFGPTAQLETNIAAPIKATTAGPCFQNITPPTPLGEPPRIRLTKLN
jgi:hypothetical protein